MGLMASIALGAYGLISYGMLLWLGATLTLPGLAGFVLAIGLAIDANVLVFERAREEYELRPGETLGKALDTGYNKAWSAILDSNITTLLAAGLLFFLASGPVKGFGVTLSIGVVASMISALVVARVLTDLAARTPFVAKRPHLSGLAGQGRLRRWLNESGPFLMRRIGVWIGVAAAIALVAVGGIVVRGLNLGVEFTGGRLLEFSTTTDLSADDAARSRERGRVPSGRGPDIIRRRRRREHHGSDRADQQRRGSQHRALAWRDRRHRTEGARRTDRPESGQGTA